MDKPKNQVPDGIPAQPTANGSSAQTNAFNRVPNANERSLQGAADFPDANQALQRKMGRASVPSYDMGVSDSSVNTTNSNPVHFQENVQAVSLD